MSTYMVDHLVSNATIVLEDVVIFGSAGGNEFLDDWLVACYEKTDDCQRIVR